jgi:hypothetical protein
MQGSLYNSFYRAMLGKVNVGIKEKFCGSVPSTTNIIVIVIFCSPLLFIIFFLISFILMVGFQMRSLCQKDIKGFHGT